MGDHTEAIQIEFDPSKVSFAELLNVFWASVDPDEPAWKRQYMSAIWPENPEQHRLARESLEAQQKQRGKKLYVELAPLGLFTNAEDYHQKYYLRHQAALLETFIARGYSDAALRESRVAARLNGFAGRVGDLAALDDEIERWGLPPMAQELLRKLGPRRWV